MFTRQSYQYLCVTVKLLEILKKLLYNDNSTRVLFKVFSIKFVAILVVKF